MSASRPLSGGLSEAERVTRLLEAERSQIGAEIHDAVIPLIFAASASASALTSSGENLPADTRAKLQQMDQWLSQAMQVARRLLTETYPPELSNTTWSQAARDTIERLYPEQCLSVDWQLDPVIDEVVSAVGFAAYRIVVESVRNAFSHGKATAIEISGSRTNSSWRICIRDDGQGFAPAEIPADRFGIRTMVGRAELVGATLRIDSQVGGPTEVLLEGLTAKH